MLTALTTGLRFRLAIAFAALAAFCFLVPPAALAFGHGEHAVHCLAHADAVGHDVAKEAGFKTHDQSHPAGSHQMTCCGLFCLSALPADGGGDVIDQMGSDATLLPATVPLLSRAPDRPDRPPIFLLFV